MSASAAYIAHIVEQIQHNVAFLVDQQQLSQADADLITTRLPGGQQEITQHAPRLPVATPGAVVRRAIPPPRPPPAQAGPQARAVWAYNGGVSHRHT